MQGGKNAFANSMFINLSDISYNDRDEKNIASRLTLYFLPRFFPYCNGREQDRHYNSWCQTH